MGLRTLELTFFVVCLSQATATTDINGELVKAASLIRVEDASGFEVPSPDGCDTNSVDAICSRYSEGYVFVYRIVVLFSGIYHMVAIWNSN
jgi:hypothetical protein